MPTGPEKNNKFARPVESSYQIDKIIKITSLFLKYNNNRYIQVNQHRPCPNCGRSSLLIQVTRIKYIASVVKTQGNPHP